MLYALHQVRAGCRTPTETPRERSARVERERRLMRRRAAIALENEGARIPLEERMELRAIVEGASRIGGTRTDLTLPPRVSRRRGGFTAKVAKQRGEFRVSMRGPLRSTPEEAAADVRATEARAIQELARRIEEEGTQRKTA